MTKRNPYWQVIRGICILAVIMIHCTNGANFSIGSTAFNTWLVFRQALKFPVAVFFFMAGYFINIGKCEKNVGEFLLTREGDLLIPYLLWTL